MIEELDSGNLVLRGLIPLERIPDEIAAATVCLGIFGTTDRARRAIPNKLFECLAVGTAVLTADSPAVRSAFTETEMALVEPGNPEALADAIRGLIGDDTRREAIARAGHERYLADYSEAPLSRRLDAELQVVLSEDMMEGLVRVVRGYREDLRMVVKNAPELGGTTKS